jgi:hypothetical protein
MAFAWVGGWVGGGGSNWIKQGISFLPLDAFEGMNNFFVTISTCINLSY